MEKITSFQVDHIRLQPGLYVSRRDKVGDAFVTTFDIRMTKPNDEPVMQTGEVHAIEHLAATYLRNDENWASRVLYFGPMGCRTGFYLLLAGSYEPADTVALLTDCFRFIRDYEGDIPGAAPKDCGNYSDMDLPAAKKRCGIYTKLLETITEDRMRYPE